MTGRIAHDRLTPFGIEAHVDLRIPLDDDDRAELRRLYDVDGLLLIRDVHLTMDEQLALCSVFGPTLPESRENYLVSNVLEDGLLGTKALRFHHDVPFVPEPYLGVAAHATD